MVAVGEGAAPVARHHHRRLQRLGELAQLVPGLRAEDAAPGEDQRPLGLAQHLRRLLQEVAVRLHPLLRGRVGQLHVRLGLQHVGRDLDLHRAGPAGPQLPEGLAHDPGHVLGPHRARRPLGHRADHLELVVDLVEHPAADADQVRLDLPGGAEHRRRAGVGGRERRGGVEQPRPRHDQAGPDAPGGARVAVGHVGGGLLVARVVDRDAVPLLVERVEGPVELHAGEPEDRLDPLALQRRHQGLPAGHPRHARSLLRRRRAHIAVRRPLIRPSPPALDRGHCSTFVLAAAPRATGNRAPPVRAWQPGSEPGRG